MKIVKRKIPGGPLDQMRETIRLIGRGIRQGSHYLPTRNLAAAMASTAAPKDYYGQAKAIYDGFLERWRYVKDPISRELLTMSPQASYKLVMAGDGVGVGAGLGAGDCDCATVALGSLYESTGFPVRLAAVARESAPPGQLMEHIYPEIRITNYGWISADPVVYPRGGFGDEAQYSRKVIYDLSGKVLSYQGNLQGLGEVKMRIPQIWNRAPFETFGCPNYEEYQDFTDYETGGVTVEGFGCLAEDWGYMEGRDLGGLSVQLDRDDLLDGLAETPVLEVSPEDYEFMYYHGGRPYLGMVALSQDGNVYSFDGLSFKKLVKKAKAAFKDLKKKVDKVLKIDSGGKASASVSVKTMSTSEAVKKLIDAGYLPKINTDQIKIALDKSNAAKLATLDSSTRARVKAVQATVKLLKQQKENIAQLAQTAEKLRLSATRKPKNLKELSSVSKGIAAYAAEAMAAEAAAAAKRAAGEAGTVRATGGPSRVATRKPKTVKLPAKVVKPVIKEVREGLKSIAPVAGVVPGMGPAIKIGLEAMATAPDAVIAKNVTKMTKAISRISPSKVKNYSAIVKEKAALATRLKDATKLYQVGRKELSAAKQQLAKLREQVKRGEIPNAEIDLRATDALRMAQSLLEQQAAQVRAASKKLQRTQTTTKKTPSKGVKRATVSRVGTTRRAATSSSGARRATTSSSGARRAVS